MTTGPAEPLARDLLAAGLASETPAVLEEVTTRAFRFLGFEATHVGGAGQTDILVTAREIPGGNALTAIIDTKAAKSGQVAEGSVQFDTLTEHRTKHAADWVCLLGPGFDTGRIRKRAARSGVALLTTAQLSEVILRHARHPLSVTHLTAVLRSEESARERLARDWSESERRQGLLARIVGVLATELQDQDEVTGGALSLDQIYLIVRGDVDPKPTPQDIRDAIALLRHPMIGAVEAMTNGSGKNESFVLVDKPSIIAAKMRSLSETFRQVDPEPLAER